MRIRQWDFTPTVMVAGVPVRSVQVGREGVQSIEFDGHALTVTTDVGVWVVGSMGVGVVLDDAPQQVAAKPLKGRK